MAERSSIDGEVELQIYTSLNTSFVGFIFAGYFTMVIAACILNFNRALPLLVLTLLGLFFYFWDTFVAKFEDNIVEAFVPCDNFIKKQWYWLKWVIYLTLVVAVLCWLVLDTAKLGVSQLISCGGLVMYICLVFIFSKYPTKVPWRTVFWGLGLQFILGIVCLRTQVGFNVFNWLGSQVQFFLQYTDAGSKFVFGDAFTHHYIAFKVLPIVIFFSTVISILYYIGFMQWLIMKVGWLMHVTMGTSPMESMVAAGSIFVGLTETPLLIRPYLSDLTKSEIHAVMTGGFATIAGTVFGIFISFGVSASHLLTASVMSAPASLAVAKLFWPEVDRRVGLKTVLSLEKGQGRNIIEAACLGASTSVSLVALIAANLIGFLALLAFLNATLSWLGNMFDCPQLSFELICSYIFMPFSFMMGVDWDDSFIVAELIGIKTFFNEFVAFEKLSVLMNKRLSGEPEYIEGVKQYLSIRSETIATYALCGFSNFGSLGILVGVLVSMAPQRSADITEVSVRALIAGTIACFMTACIAGLLYIPVTDVTCSTFLENSFNASSLPSNSTQLVQCCTDLFNNTIVNTTHYVFGGNYILTSLIGCCKVMDSSTFVCM
eukprot:gi/632976858/ref/XP_007905023.1/ PREDICTED: solute carrier family 28 member 3 [Callorhinchus milii]